MCGGAVTVAAAYALGVALGAGSSVVPGPCGLAVIDAATRLGLRRAVATAIGAGLGDLTYAALGVFGAGAVITRAPALTTACIAFSSVALVAYGVATLCGWFRARRAPSGSLGGVAVGFATLACNPAALVTWSAVVGVQLAAATRAEHAAAVLGIGTGSLAWFIGMACVAHRKRDAIGPRLQRLVQVVASLMVVYGACSLVRVLPSR
jgi:threonine/homoserine/homoserine lactone efflux protein